MVRVTAKGQFTKKQIIWVAADMFLEKGYYATSIRDIINAANISKGAFYHHFASKLELFRKVIEYYLDLEDEIFNPSELEKLELEQAFEHIFKQYYEFLIKITAQTGRSLLHFQRLFYEALILLPDIAERVKQSYQQIIELFVQKAMEQKQLPQQQALNYIKHHILLFDGALHWLSLFPQVKLEELLDIMLRCKA